MPEQAIFFTKGKLHDDIPLSVDITAPIDEFLKTVKIGKKTQVFNIYCSKGGGIICGVASPPLMFSRLNVIPKEGTK